MSNLNLNVSNNCVLIFREVGVSEQWVGQYESLAIALGYVWIDILQNKEQANATKHIVFDYEEPKLYDKRIVVSATAQDFGMPDDPDFKEPIVKKYEWVILTSEPTEKKEPIDISNEEINTYGKVWPWNQ